MNEVAAKAQVLVVDDQPANIEILAAALQTEYDVRVANNGELALQIVHTQLLPDLILLDVMMPGLSGFEVCQRLKNDPVTQYIPIIFVTAKNDIKDEQYGLSLGAVDYINKPFSLPIVMARVRNHVLLKVRTELLRKSEERFRSTFEASPLGVTNSDLQGRLLEVNQGYCDFVGYCAEELRTMSYQQITAPEFLQLDAEMTSQTLAGDISEFNHDKQYLHKNGQRVWGHLWVKLIRDVNGLPLHFIGVVENIDRRKKLEASNNLLLQAVEQSPTSVVITDLEANIEYVNQAFIRNSGYSLEEIMGQNPRVMQSGKTPPATYAELWATLTRGEIWKGELINLRKNGEEYTELAVISPVRYTDGTVLHYLGIKEDITERKATEKQLKLAASVFTHTQEGIMITDPEGRIIDVNYAFCLITGYARAEVLGRNPRILKSGQQDTAFYSIMWQSILEKGHWYGEVWNQRKNGQVYAAMLNISAVFNDDEQLSHFVALFSDITTSKTYEYQLERIAHYDALTNLPNRVLLADRLNQGMVQTQRSSKLLAVVYLDLDGFKEINDTHGHEIGDKVLISTADRMTKVLRKVDTLARLGGDEFVAVLVDLDSVDESLAMLKRLLNAAAEQFVLGKRVFKVSASLGVSFYPQKLEITADQLLRQADQAMYQAKLAGKNRYHIYDPAYDNTIREYHETLEDIQCALQNQDFVLYYQPKVNMRTGVVIGAEALLRWQHAEKGLLLPADFLPTVKDHIVSIAIGEWVIHAALKQIEYWQSMGISLPISVNISALHLQQPNFVERLQQIMRQHANVKPDFLEIEVLETSALADLPRVSQLIKSCQAFGVKFALDDFGAGYSSLTYLKSLPVQILKIDQSFVCEMLNNPDDLVILDSVIGLSTAFKRMLIAEGVETIEHGEILLQLGCEFAQGYGIARPMPAEELPKWMASW
jgi:diguanylate cyclase (GGDEF)-like protein/PAS domain S-box-containing protein